MKQQRNNVSRPQLEDVSRDGVTHTGLGRATDAGGADIAVEVIRSARRKRTVQGKLVGNTLQVRVPASLDARQEAELVAEMLAKVQRRMTSTRLSDDDLEARAQRLNRTVLDGQAQWSSVRWVSNQNSRWGSCTPSTGEIRISDRLRGVPDYVLDAVLVHELVHTFIRTGHSAEFWRWADRAPQAERAKGFLEAWARFPL